MTAPTLVRSSANTDVTSPATPGSITAAAGNLLVYCIISYGPVPTIATPTGGGTWRVIQNIVVNSVASMAMFALPNNAGGAINPSSVLVNTEEWLAAIFEFTQTGANCGVEGSNVPVSSQEVQLFNAFPSTPCNADTLFAYFLAYGPTTMTPQNSFSVPYASWSTTVRPQTGVNIETDFFWAFTRAPGPMPQAAGKMAILHAAGQIAAWFNIIPESVTQHTNVGGQSGVYVGQFNQGMIGG